MEENVTPGGIVVVVPGEPLSELAVDMTGSFEDSGSSGASERDAANLKLVERFIRKFMA